MKLQIVLALAATAACQVAAQDKNPSQASHWQMPYQMEFWRYASVSVGRSAYDFECQHDTKLPCDENDKSAFKVAAGGRFAPAFGMEIHYVDLGDVSVPRLQGHTSAHGVNLSLVAATTAFDRIDFNARIGTVYGWTHTRQRDASISCILDAPHDPTCNLSGRDHGFGLSYGAGLSTRIARQVQLRFDWDRYRLPFVEGRDFRGVGGERDVGLWSVGFKFLF
jgi:OOP family OmpA-OmpF porin